ncbi:hypothetical protein CONCODRAFT_105340 [Conidiobolus coronatus NRRL 28638]|uniref:Galactose oxidase n=1 Tax=Conidiobolus coronatus (strain ATCC 28846 / CBS 209.66 / NRRL 28638) TaxID=796925 RepID=A0A137P0M9_CONC2|nr:hypothetical protein CONCODRAFT_105340 [Conidiobolus coronatus NRRL 28638]|eukprot:KXN68409.1 hypothetical protein CONCODRAFT_105340 [Conidiobolus coronatus NRRL 28638]
MNLHQILFNNFRLSICLIIIGSCLTFQIPPVIPSSVILNNRYLYIYGSSDAKSSDAKFLNVYDLNKGSIKDLTTVSSEKIGNIDGYSPSFIPLKNDASVGVLEYGIQQSLIKGDIPAQSFLLPTDNNKYGTKFQDNKFRNSTVPGLFPQQGYSVVRIDLPNDTSIYYFIGGIVYSKKLNEGAISRAFWSYTVDKDGKGDWTNLNETTTKYGNSNLPHLAYHSCTATNNERIFCVGGMNQMDNSTSVLYETDGAKIPNGPNIQLRTVYMYEVSTKKWTSIAVTKGEECFGFNVIGHSLISFQSYLYLIGGVNQLGVDGDTNQRFVHSCRYDTNLQTWSRVDFQENGKSVDLSTAFQTIQQISPTYFIAGYGYRDTGSSLGPLIGISISPNNYTLVNAIPPISQSKDQGQPEQSQPKGSPTPVYVIISISVSVTAIIFGIIGFLLYRYKLRNNVNQVESDKSNSNSQLRGNGTLFNSVPKHHRATLWSDSITGNLAKPSKAHYRYNGSNEMLIPLSETGDTNLEYGHFDHFQHQPTISRDSIDLSPMASANQLPQFDIGKTSASPSFTSLNYLTRSNSDLRTTSSSATLGDGNTNLTKTKF